LFIMSRVYANGQTAGGPTDPHMWGYGGGWGWMIFGPVMMIVVIAAIVAVVVLLVRWLGGPRQDSHPAHPSPPAQAPLDILKERFARGEIDKEEFEERRRLLSD
jgi:putative membrane protein